MADSSDIMNALISKLGSDATLLALMPNGVYEDVAPPNSTRFVIVSQILSQDVDVFGGRAYEEPLFLIEARATAASHGDVKAAAARIDALLDGTNPASVTLPVSGYQLMAIAREEFVRLTERDQADETVVWKRRGGRYRVKMSLT